MTEKSKPKIAIIGAGLAGLSLARHLDESANVILFEKSNKPGGRLSTLNEQGFSFDHGTQFFTAKNEAFKTFVKELQLNDVVRQWDARFVELKSGQVEIERVWDEEFPHYVGFPEMNSIPKYMAQDLDIRCNHLITHIKKIKSNWFLETADSEFGPFDWLVIAIPAEQANDLLPKNFSLKTDLQNIMMKPCFALLLGYQDANCFNWDAAFVSDSILSWVSVNSSKPQRGDPLAIVAMSSNEWAKDNFDKPESIVIKEMFNELKKISNTNLSEAIFVKLKKWKYANADRQKYAIELIDDSSKLACCGDWCISGRVESAFMTSLNLANQLKRSYL